MTRFRYSLLGMLVALTAVCTILVTLTREFRQQQEVVREVKRLGGEVAYESINGGAWKSLFPSVRSVYIKTDGMSARQLGLLLDQLSQMPTLEQLEIVSGLSQREYYMRCIGGVEDIALPTRPRNVLPIAIADCREKLDMVASCLPDCVIIVNLRQYVPPGPRGDGKAREQTPD